MKRLSRLIICVFSKIIMEKKDIPLSETKDVHEGDVLIFKDSVYIPDKGKTEARRKRILALQEDLWA